MTLSSAKILGLTLLSLSVGAAGCSGKLGEPVALVNPLPRGEAATSVDTFTATISAIDYQARTVTLRSESGEARKFRVGPEVQNFSQAKVGDRVTIGYVQAVAMDVGPDDGSFRPSVTTTFDRAAPGSKPAALATQTVTLKASVEAIDHDKRLIALRGPEGNTVTLKVGETAQRFREVKKGDRVVVVYSEAIAIAVSAPTPVS